jgi:hypothetical protein
MQKITNSIAAEISELLDDENNSIDVLYQPSDGWVVFFGHAQNAALTFPELDKLLSLENSEALAFLESKTI